MMPVDSDCDKIVPSMGELLIEICFLHFITENDVIRHGRYFPLFKNEKMQGVVIFIPVM